MYSSWIPLYVASIIHHRDMSNDAYQRIATKMTKFTVVALVFFICTFVSQMGMAKANVFDTYCALLCEVVLH
ncbi:uncharacterized protein L969DRAFT_88298 [Mixia osmundae IAM 14324]|uniref:uncharacterized protein n=1 Tax=Mixia osmundae (strain CBS 9802 / IAM 14324 / JCM 22182 / KY 12970) TaxID=764103 RepID=UPI0004A55245|nr:uncharacterized protein L969DRAFT_88298 [Mixia osmundae IAM 14324]KEI38927.1 hypothetical protein L969DRAFT_88298 [Mixia osmundae IAM 14324]